jgi:hypothetical protein
MPKIKALLWRLVYAVLLVIVLLFITPLVLELVGLGMPSGPALTLLRFAFACLILIFIFFGPEPYAPF